MEAPRQWSSKNEERKEFITFNDNSLKFTVTLVARESKGARGLSGRRLSDLRGGLLPFAFSQIFQN